MTAEGLLLQRDPQPEGGAGHHLRAVHPRPARDTQEGGRHAHLLKVTHPADENNPNYTITITIKCKCVSVRNLVCWPNCWGGGWFQTLVTVNNIIWTM